MTDASAASLTIDLGALTANWRSLAAKAGPAECAAVVKADAYGIGAAQAVPALRAAGCRTFFVALPEEGRRARAVAPDAVIYVLNGFFSDAAALYREAALRPVLNSLEETESWARLGGGAASAIQVDTGMNRLGLSLREAIGLARRKGLLAAISPRLLISHLACADAPAHPLNVEQLALFKQLRAQFPALPASMANSAGVFLGPDYHFDLIRPGIALYGANFAQNHPSLNTVVTLSTRVLQIRQAPAGESVGYGAAERLKCDTRIAVLSAGYADGYHRATGSSDARRGGSAHIRGRKVPILGRVSMDLIAIDVTDVVGASPGDRAELFGPNIPIDEVAGAAATIAYELLTGLSRRAERVYLR
ncbi:MAG: alanine racemase [Rhizobiales bacterium]|nr:alanine racemase [Hyphomicrobiales bacterium]